MADSCAFIELTQSHNLMACARDDREACTYMYMYMNYTMESARTIATCSKYICGTLSLRDGRPPNSLG